VIDDEFLSAEFIRRFGLLEGLASAQPKFFEQIRQHRNAALQEKSPFTSRHSLLATRYSPSAALFARQEPHPPKFSTDSKSVSTVTKPAEAG